MDVATLAMALTGALGIVSSVLGAKFVKARNMLDDASVFIDDVYDTLEIVNKALEDEKITPAELENVKAKLIELQKDIDNITQY